MQTPNHKDNTCSALLSNQGMVVGGYAFIQMDDVELAIVLEYWERKRNIWVYGGKCLEK